VFLGSHGIHKYPDEMGVTQNETPDKIADPLRR
jgi:hypothetical protein